MRHRGVSHGCYGEHGSHQCGSEGSGQPQRQGAEGLPVGPLARCAVGDADPDAWFPVAIEPQGTRCQAAAALALCEKCALRAECLEVSMRHWDTIGRHGIWGGFVAAERASLRMAWCDGAPATALVRLPSAGTCRGSSSRLQTEQRSAPAA